MATYEVVIETFSKLKITSRTISHEPVTDGTTWIAALSASASDIKYVVTKTLLFKPKTAKTAAVTPVIVITLEGISAPIKAIEKELSLKDCRIATEDILKDIFGTTKDAISPFALRNVPTENIPNIRLVIDSAILTTPENILLAFHPSVADKTIFISVNDLKTYISDVGIEIIEIDFKQLSSETSASSSSKDTKPVPKNTNTDKIDALIEGAAQIGIEVRKELDFPTWYQQVITRSELIDYYDVSGCYILRPLAYGIWKVITAFFDEKINEMGVEDTYFPMFVSQKALEREKDHIDGFAPEVAWVTKAGNSKLEEPIAIRPTSETVMYPYFAKWIRSHRDLPFKINQWCSVVRWEFKNPQPFLRTREFLWQEGHTAHLTKAEADKEVLDILDLYEQVYTDLLAVPVIKGIKSEKEKFAGGLYTTTVEGFIPATGRGIQGGTSHCLGQNFSKMFNIVIEDPNAPASATEESKKIHVWQNSWGLSTRTIGALVMVHGDNKGLVLPPRVANIQVIVIPCGLAGKTDEEKNAVIKSCEDVVSRLKKVGIKAKGDYRDEKTTGYKFYHWELKGVPLRLEIGPQDIKKKQTTAIRRDTGAKSFISLSGLESEASTLLNTIQSDMYMRAKEEFDDRHVRVDKWEDFVPTLNRKCACLIAWCERTECEDDIKERSAKQVEDPTKPVDERAPSAGAKSLCIPLEQPEKDPIIPGVTKCVACGQDAKRFAYFGRSY